MTEKDQINNYMLRRYHSRRNKAIEILGGTCVVCGSVDSLEIDHIDPELKSFSISKLWSVSEKRYLDELSKCQLLCKEHHKIKTIIEKSVNHGEGLTGKRNCYCELCAPLKKIYNAQYRRS